MEYIIILYPLSRFERNEFETLDSMEIIERLKPVQTQARILPNCPIEADDWNDWDDEAKDTLFGGNEDDYCQAKAALISYFGCRERMERLMMGNWAVGITDMTLEEIQERLPKAKGEDWSGMDLEAVSCARDTDRDNAYAELRSLVEDACGMQPIEPTDMSVTYGHATHRVTVRAVLLKWEYEDADGNVTCNLVAVDSEFSNWDILDLFATKQIKQLSEKVKNSNQ